MKFHEPSLLQPIPDNAQVAFRGVVFDVYQWQQKQFDGSTCTFEKLTRHDTGTVIAATPDGKILLNKEIQPGMREFVGLPGGKVDAGEAPMAAIQRELLEETGYVATDWVQWLSVHPSEKINYTARSYLARGAKPVTEPQEAAGERVELLKVTFDEFMDLMLDNEYRDPEVALGLLRATAIEGRLREIKRALGLTL